MSRTTPIEQIINKVTTGNKKIHNLECMIANLRCESGVPDIYITVNGKNGRTELNKGISSKQTIENMIITLGCEIAEINKTISKDAEFLTSIQRFAESQLSDSK